MSPALGKVKRTESESSVGPTVPTFQVKGRNDLAGYYVSLLQSLKPQNQIKTSECDSPHDVASAQYNSLLSSADITKRQTAVLWGPKSSEESGQFSLLAQLADRHSKILEQKSSEESGQFSSLAQLADRHSKQQEPKSSEESSQFSSLAQLADRHLKILESKPSDNRSQFSSLAQLAKKRSKILKPDSSEESGHFSSLAQLANKSSLEADRQSEGHSSSSLADRYGKVTKLCAPHGDTNLSTLMKPADIRAVGLQSELTSQHRRVCGEGSMSSLTGFSSDHLEAAENKAIGSGRHVTETGSGRTSCSQTGHVGPKTSRPFPPEEQAVPLAGRRARCPQASVPQRTGEPARDCGATSDSGSSVGVEPSPAGRALSEEEVEMDLEIDFTDALMSPGSRPSRTCANVRPEITCWESEDMQQDVPSDSAVLDAMLTSAILDQKLPSRKRKSPFGRTLCRKWKRLSTPYIPPKKQSLGTVVRFAFDTLSPDDRALEARPQYMIGTRYFGNTSVQM
jgi:hypothetical protein